MRLEFFTVPAAGDPESVEALNRRLAAGRIISVERQFVANGEASFWSICVSTQGEGKQTASRTKRNAVDYKERLSADDFAIFARLRELRKELASEDGVPVYAVFTNEQLAEIARRRVSSLAALKEIEGVGEARAGKYGKRILSIMGSFSLITSSQSDEAQPRNH